MGDFPLDALPKPLADLAKAAGAAGGFSPEFVAIPGLSVLAAAVGGRAVLKVQRTFKGRPILWTFTSAPPGAAKGPGQRAVVAPLVKLQGRWAAQHQEALAKYAADLATWEATPKKDREPDGEPDPPPPPRRCLVGDATLESLAPILLENPAGGVLWEREELKAIVGGLDQYRAAGKGAGRSSFLELHDGQHLLVDRVVRGSLFVPEPRVSVAGGMVSGGFASVLGGGDGLGPRFLGAHLPEAGLALVNLDRDVRQSVIDDWDNLIRVMITRPDEGEALPALEPDQVTEVRLSSDARRVWTATTRAFHKTWGRGETTTFGQQVIAKGSVHLASLALVIHIAENPTKIPTELSGETMGRAAKLIQYFINQALGLDMLEPSAAASRATRDLDEGCAVLAAWLHRRPHGVARVGDIQAAHVAGCRTAKEVGLLVDRYGEVYPGCVVKERREGVTKGPVPVDVFAPGTPHGTPATPATPATDTSPNGVPEGAPRSDSEINTPADTSLGDKPVAGVAGVAGVPPAPERDGHARPEVPLPADQDQSAAVPEWEPS